MSVMPGGRGTGGGADQHTCVSRDGAFLNNGCCARRPGWCLVLGLRDAGGGGWVGGYEGKNKLVYVKWASHFWLSIQTFIFAQRKFFLVLVWFYSPVHCSSHSMTSFQSSELTELPVVENSQLFAQRAHSARYAP